MEEKKYKEDNLEENLSTIMTILSLNSKQREIFQDYEKLKKTESNPIRTICKKHSIKKVELTNILKAAEAIKIKNTKKLVALSLIVNTLEEKDLPKIASRLSSDELIIIKLFKSSKSSAEFLIKTAWNFNLTIDKAFTFVQSKCKSIENELRKYHLENKNRYTFQKSISAYSQENIQKALECLDPRTYDVMCLYFGLNDNECQSEKEISKKYNLTQSAIGWILRNGHSKIIHLLENPDELNNELEKINKIISEKYYSKLEIDSSLIKFSSISQDILCMHYGIKEKKAYSNKAIAKKYNIPLDSLNELIRVISHTFKDYLNNNISVNLESSLLDLLERNNLNTVMSSINSLTEVEKKYFCMYHGICGYKKHSIQQLSSEFNLPDTEAYINILEIEKTIKNNIQEGIKKHKVVERQKEFKNRLVSSNSKYLLKAYDYLTDNEYHLLDLYYCVENDNYYTIEQITRMLSCTKKEYNDQLTAIIKKLNYSLEQNKNWQKSSSESKK